jgi:lipopolysaccharide/colanic/teichoic acid biosynthesis glycosyltransferase
MKRAVVIATGHSAEDAGDWSPPEVSLFDRPFIQHVVEHLCAQGIRNMDIVLCEHAERLEAFLGDGRRWGCEFRFHLSRDPARPYARLRALKFEDPRKPILLVSGHRIPNLSIADLVASSGVVVPVSCHEKEEAFGPGAGAWIGWAKVPAGILSTIDEAWTEGELGVDLYRRMAAEGGREVMVDVCLSTDSPRVYLRSVRHFLAKRFTSLLLSAHEVEDGIWLDRNVMLHPTAAVQGPVYIGSDVRIGAGASLGPFAVVGPRCVIEKRSSVRDAAVLPGSYVGEGLEVESAIVDRNLLIDTQSGVAVSVADFLLGSMGGREISRFLTAVVSRVFGLVLFVTTLPVLAVAWLLLTLLRRAPALYTRDAVRLPTVPDSFQWRTFTQYSFLPFEAVYPGSIPRVGFAGRVVRAVLVLLPGLLNVVRGDMRFAGQPPRTRSEVEALPTDWRSMYLKGKVGLVTEAEVLFDREPLADEQYYAEAGYAVLSGFRHDLTLVLRKLMTVVTGRPAPLR